ncbi:hypothetical protein LguiB_005715 [Lonicera macranthoides]
MNGKPSIHLANQSANLNAVATSKHTNPISHAPSKVNAIKSKQHLVPFSGTNTSVFASDPTIVVRSNQKPQLQPVTTATASLATQYRDVARAVNNNSMPTNTSMAPDEVFGAHSPTSYQIQSPSHKLASPHNDDLVA